MMSKFQKLTKITHYTVQQIFAYIYKAIIKITVENFTIATCAVEVPKTLSFKGTCTLYLTMDSYESYYTMHTATFFTPSFFFF